MSIPRKCERKRKPLQNLWAKHVQKGESYFLPANSGNYTVQGSCQTLVTCV